MIVFRHMSIKWKITLISLLVSYSAALLVSTALFLTDVTLLRRALIQDLTTLAQIAALNVSAPLTFSDQQAAKETLFAFGAKSGVLFAGVYDRDGQMFASYRREGSNQLVPGAPPPLTAPQFEDGALCLSQPVILDGERIGTVYIRHGLSRLHSRLRHHAGVTVAVFAGAVCVALLLAWKLQGLISAPITSLTGTAEQISKHGDYSVRASEHGQGGDEIGVLVAGFNAMLTRIQDSDTELREHREHLKELVERRTGELRQANEELRREIGEREEAEKQRRSLESQLRQKQRLASIGTLAGGVAHEINNPINGIMNYAQLIADGLGSEGGELEDYAQEIMRETERVAGIVRNLLAFSRQEAQKRDRVKLTEILDATLSLIRTIVRCDQIALELDISEGLPEVNCRSRQIQQVLMNLVTNARDALNERFAGYDPEKRIKVIARSIERDGKLWVRTTVEDSGNGIPEEIRDRLFDPFFTTKSRALSAGLGLAISYGIVRDHGGQLQVESSPGNYTRFHLDLPAAPRDTPDPD